VARRIAVLGPGRVVDADALAARALAEAARDGRLRAALGDGFVTSGGEPDRAALADRVFSDPASLDAIERLTHPDVRAAILAEVEAHRRGGGPPVLVLDVPLLLETGLDRLCDRLWYVEAGADTRRRRTTARGLAQEDLARREARQSPIERKRARADLVIPNEESGEGHPPDPLDRRILEGLRALGVAGPRDP
jgi:dephospho-CoA kinase